MISRLLSHYVHLSLANGQRLDRFRCKHFCGFLLLWVDDYRSEFRSVPFVHEPYANASTLTLWDEPGTKRRDFDITNAPIVSSRADPLLFANTSACFRCVFIAHLT